MNKYLYKIKDLEIPLWLKYWFVRKSKINFDLSEILNGTSFDLTDTVNKKLHLINIFGNSNQDGIPTPENTININSAGDNGSINEIISENLNAVILPEQYQQVEYIQSTGTQYIDTGIKTDVDIAMESVLKTTAASNELDYSGACYNGRLGWLLFGSYGNDKLVCYFARDNRAGVEIKFDNNFHKYYLKNGLQKIDNVSNNNTITQMATDFNIYLFKGNVDFEANFVEKQIIKYFKIWKNETLVRDFIPCYRKSDGVIGFYDLVTRTFFTNAGTGTFIAGEEIIKQTYTIPCQQPMRSVGNVRDTFAKVDGVWYERHYIKRGNVNDFGSFIDVTSTTGDNLYCVACNNNIDLSPNVTLGSVISNIFEPKILGSTSDTTNVSNVRFNMGIARHSSTTQIIISIEKSYLTELTVQAFRQFLVDNNFYFDCILNEPVDLPCTQAQITALESLQKARTYKNITHIYSEDEVPANLEIQYYKEKGE